MISVHYTDRYTDLITFKTVFLQQNPHKLKIYNYSQKTSYTKNLKNDD